MFTGPSPDGGQMNDSQLDSKEPWKSGYGLNNVQLFGSVEDFMQCSCYSFKIKTGMLPKTELSDGI